MPGIFISYRREDSGGWTGRLYPALTKRFGKDRVFIDTDTLVPGVSFAEAIKEHLSSCSVVIIVIGPQWITIRDKNGQRRLDIPNDLVRTEAAMALARKDLPVIPVLVGGAAMPSDQQLPDDLKELTQRNAYTFSDRHWTIDQNSLLSHLSGLLDKQRKFRLRRTAEARSTPITHSGPSHAKRQHSLFSTFIAFAAIFIGGSFLTFAQLWRLGPVYRDEVNVDGLMSSISMGIQTGLYSRFVLLPALCPYFMRIVDSKARLENIRRSIANDKQSSYDQKETHSIFTLCNAQDWTENLLTSGWNFGLHLSYIVSYFKSYAILYTIDFSQLELEARNEAHRAELAAAAAQEIRDLVNQ